MSLINIIKIASAASLCLFAMPAFAMQTIVCTSENNTFVRCDLPNADQRHVSLHTAKSSYCTANNWGADSRGIWVDHNCSAEFQYHSLTSNNSSSNNYSNSNNDGTNIVVAPYVEPYYTTPYYGQYYYGPGGFVFYNGEGNYHDHHNGEHYHHNGGSYHHDGGGHASGFHGGGGHR